MSIACLAFTEKGMKLARLLASELGATAERSGHPLTLRAWTEKHFHSDRALIYVGAVGIAVRAVAPFVQSKTTDPAVVVVDECAQFAVPLLSGHLGGANDLARKVAKICGAQPVITTATDSNGIFAVDEWARCQQCAVLHAPRIRNVSGALLAGQSVRIKSEMPIEGTPPQNVHLVEEGPYDVYVGLAPQPESVLWLVPQIVVLGIGCRKATPCRTLENAFTAFGITPQAVCAVASIDLKAQEGGLLEFCRNHDWMLQTYSAAELALVEGTFTPSVFVEKTTGVDNVCERAAVLCSGGILVKPKTAGDGITLAAAVKPYRMDWRFHNEW